MVGVKTCVHMALSGTTELRLHNQKWPTEMFTISICQYYLQQEIPIELFDVSIYLKWEKSVSAHFKGNETTGNQLVSFPKTKLTE